MKKTLDKEQFLSGIASECSPVKVAEPPEKRWPLLFVVMLLWSTGMLMALGVRQRPIETKALIFFLVEAGLLLVLLYLSGMLLLRQAIPGEPVSRLTQNLKVLLGLWIAYLIAGELLHVSGPMPLVGVDCALLIGVGALLPTALLVAELRRGYVLRRQEAVFIAFLAGAISALLAVQFHCEWESTLHHLVFHVLPVLGTAFFGYVIASAKPLRLRGRQ